VKKLGRIGGVGHRINGDRTTRTRGVGWEYVHVCVDNASRLAYVEVLSDEESHTTAAFLTRAVSWYARRGVIVEAVMSDNGGNYRSRIFKAELGRHGIRHLRTRPYRPRTNGKAERFIQTLLREWAYVRPYESSAVRAAALPRWLGYYNRARPHGGLGGASPFRWLRSGPEQRP
jgi:transposase InsO family protein